MRYGRDNYEYHTLNSLYSFLGFYALLSLSNLFEGCGLVQTRV